MLKADKTYSDFMLYDRNREAWATCYTSILGPHSSVDNLSYTHSSYSLPCLPVISEPSKAKPPLDSRRSPPSDLLVINTTYEPSSPTNKKSIYSSDKTINYRLTCQEQQRAEAGVKIESSSKLEAEVRVLSCFHSM